MNITTSAKGKKRKAIGGSLVQVRVGSEGFYLYQREARNLARSRLDCAINWIFFYWKASYEEMYAFFMRSSTESTTRIANWLHVKRSKLRVL